MIVKIDLVLCIEDLCWVLFDYPVGVLIDRLLYMHIYTYIFLNLGYDPERWPEWSNSVVSLDCTKTS
jgi:hypothetical protein